MTDSDFQRSAQTEQVVEERPLASAILAVAVLALAACASQTPSGPNAGQLRNGEQCSDTASPATSLRARFLGTATLVFEDGETVLLTDGFFSRPSGLAVLFGKVRPDEARIGCALQRASLQSVAAVLVTHSHYDHALDSALVAQQTGAELVGSASTIRIATSQSSSHSRLREIPGPPMFYGRFRVRSIETPHSVPLRYPGDIRMTMKLPARASEYKEGGNYSFLVQHDKTRILVVPSANFSEGMFQGIEADVVFLSAGSLGHRSRSDIEKYWRETVAETGAKKVVLIHWDDFTKPLDEPLVPFSPFVDNSKRAMEILRGLAGKDVDFVVPVAFQPIGIE